MMRRSEENFMLNRWKLGKDAPASVFSTALSSILYSTEGRRQQVSQINSDVADVQLMSD